MNKKGFTLVELLAVIVILGVIGSIAVISYTSYIDKSKESSYKDAEITVASAMEDLYTYCMANNSNAGFCKSYPDYNMTDRTTIDFLVNAGFMDKVSDTSGLSNICSGYVDVKNTATNGVKLEYKVCLICSNYKSSDCE